LIPSEKPFFPDYGGASELAEDEPTFDELRMFARAASALNLVYPAEIANIAQPGDVIEILDQDQNQLYRSFSFFSFCNYSLNDLNNYSLPELYEADSDLFPELQRIHREILSGDRSVIDLAHFREYFVQERLTPERAGFWVRERYLFRAVNPISGERYIVRVRRVRNEGDVH
jgi:hypothetical protein